MIPGLVEDNERATEIVLQLMESYETHPIKSAATFRNAILDGWFAYSPALDVNEAAVNAGITVIRSTVAEGKMIDFGFLPNKLLKETGLRTREVFEAGELQHPYSEWFAVSAWEGGCCGYLVSTKDERDILVIETYGVHAPGLAPAIIVNDVIGIKIKEDGSETLVSPIRSVFPQLNTDQEISNRCGNVLDPLVTFLRMLSDASVPVTDVPAPAKLNKARAKKGFPLIPPHTRVETSDYVSLFRHASRGETANRGGHHASPIPHWRRAHKRHLHDGKVIPVRSSKINWRESEELHRLFTRVKP